MNRKGQLLSIEIILTLVIFLAVFSGMYFFFSYLFTDYILTDEQLSKEAQVDESFARLTLTQGYPHNWNVLNLSLESPRYVGLADGAGSLSREKLSFIANQNDTFYDSLKGSLGFFEDTINVSLRVFLFNGTNKIENTSLLFGLESTEYSQRYVRSHFFALGEVPHILQMEVFYE